MKQLFLSFSLFFSTLAFCANLSKDEFYNQYIANYQDIPMNVKIQQMLMISFDGKNVSYEDSKLLQKYNVGGFILFNNNIHSPQQLQKLTEDLQNFSIIPLFIALDQEGGKVERLKAEKGFNIHIPDAKTLHKQGENIIYQQATKQAKILFENHINVNFAPIVDVDKNHLNPVIGALNRSFSSEAEEVFQDAKVFIEGQANYNIINVIKHFPGHGSSKKDSHKGFVDITNTFSDDELKPFTDFIDNDFAGMIMVGHLYHKNIDSKFPASISKKWVDILKNNMNYKGIIITDDLKMGAVKNNFSFEQIIENTIAAGVDIMLYADNLQEPNNIIERTLKVAKRVIAQGKISEQQINDAYLRIMQLKMQKLF